MKASLLKTRISFQVKVLVPVLAVMALLIAATIWLVNRRISKQMHETATRQLDTAAKVFTKLHEGQIRTLLSKNHNLLNEPRFRAVTRSGDLPTIKQNVEEAMHEMFSGNDANVAVFTATKDNGLQLISSAANMNLSVAAFNAQAFESIRQAAQGEAGMDTIRVGTNMFDIVSLPVSADADMNGVLPAGAQITGVLTFGLRIDGEQARETRQITRSEIVFLADGQVAASSLPKPELFPSLIDRFNSLPSTQTSAFTHPELLLNDEHFLCRAGRFPSLSGDPRVGYLLLSSYQDSWVTLRAMQQMLLVVGLLGIGVGGVIVWLLIRRITQRLRELRDSAEAVGRGDFSRRVEVSSHDECGELASAFNQMTENIKVSREELEKTVETLKATQSQLIQSEKLSGIGEFVAGVAHELNNPLTSVMGFSELLQQSDLPEQQRRYLDVIFKSAKRCQKIVQSLLSFARRHAPERKVISVNEVIESAAEILQYQMRTSNIDVVMQLDPHLPATEVDPHQMQQVFLNIINNARQAMEGRTVKGRLQISSAAIEGRVRIAFGDNGPGIAPENLKRVFNPFFTTKEVGKGTGLGLSLCYGIVSEHGGTITANSKFGEGATFVIELPITQPTAHPVEQSLAPQPSESAPDPTGKRVLVVDDEDMILQMIREVLTRNGYKVDIAHDGEAALRRLGQYHYDLALCDWKMPGLNGREVFEKLQASNPAMSERMIFITGDTVNEQVREFLRMRNKVCISKPFTLVEFHSAIHQVLKSN